jgi:hypothetical protein
MLCSDGGLITPRKESSSAACEISTAKLSAAMHKNDTIRKSFIGVDWQSGMAM